MNRRKLGRIRKCIGAVTLTVSLFACSLTALAYEDVHKVNADGEALVAGVSEDMGSGSVDIADGRVFRDAEAGLALETTDADLDAVEILYDEQFVDEAGNIYEVNTEVQPYGSCNHELKSGIYQRHVRYTDGHCKVEYYNAEWCVHCGEVWAHDRIKTVIYDTCPHQ